MPNDIAFLHDIPVDVVIELGRTRLTIRELAELGVDEVLELERPADQPLDIVVGDRLYARGEVVMVGDRMALRVTEVVGQARETAQPALAETA
ncbi:MAG: flagellar motor switch protein FliN [Proteobacteria bacterium]|nr:flagellar motor switch protein FliN [Pseudomonadota bacterium]MCP4919863.1 flagellar motor switch protein FliN [Pseudomonadota bacterium]